METPHIIFFACVVIYTLVAAMIDWRTRKLPNKMTAPALVAGVVFHAVWGWFEGGGAGVVSHLLFAAGGFALGFGILFVLWVIGSGGGGDVKFMAALGAWIEPPADSVGLPGGRHRHRDWKCCGVDEVCDSAGHHANQREVLRGRSQDQGRPSKTPDPFLWSGGGAGHLDRARPPRGPLAGGREGSRRGGPGSSGGVVLPPTSTNWHSVPSPITMLIAIQLTSIQLVAIENRSLKHKPFTNVYFF